VNAVVVAGAMVRVMIEIKVSVVAERLITSQLNP